MDSNAYKILYDYFDPDDLARVEEGSAPYLPATGLLAILRNYQDQAFPVLAQKGDGTVTAIEAMTATRVLVEDLTGAYG